jgi:hypothetical protein
VLDAAGGEEGQDFAERGVAGRGGLEVVDGREDVVGDVLRRRSAVEFLAKMLVAERGVAGVGKRGAAAAVGGSESAAFSAAAKFSFAN